VGPAAALVAEVRAAGAPAYVAEPGVLEKLTGYHVHRGLLAAMDRRPLPAVAELLAGARRIAVLEDVVDHTNVGAAFRSAAAFGVDAVLVTPRCADPLYRRSVRTSMGTVFQVPWTRLDDWPGALAVLRDAGWTTAALTLDPAAVPLPEFAATNPDRLALILGTEGDGLRPSTVAAAAVAVSIPMAGGVDSLNVAAAAAVAFYATRATV
jgi:tRNA G18 (ribose-2'-O)-methylase SpoU